MNNPRPVLYFLVLFIALFLVFLQPVHAEEIPSSSAKSGYGIIGGKWQRTDGGYIIKISDIQADGRAKVEYFNPRPIHVSRSTISTKKELIKLLIRFQDKGYEGSTYILFYYAEKDALVGFYYQAAMDKTYEVIFLRKHN